MNLPICGVDMIRSDHGPLVLEVNSSASLKTPELITGRDVATKVIEYVERNAKQRNKKDKNRRLSHLSKNPFCQWL
jgi:ribosomal protein S6--L-glutamate ligase